MEAHGDEQLMATGTPHRAPEEESWCSIEAMPARRPPIAERPLERILLVEDDRDIGNLVSVVLGEVGGYTIKACTSAEQALEAAPSFRPDLLLLDVMMPGADGVSALKGLRGIDATRDTPVVFMTAMAQAEDRARYDALGCLGLIAKPFDPLTLAHTLEALWGRHVEERPRPFANEFEALRRAYVGELPGRIEAMQAAAEALAVRGWDRPTVESLYRETHRLTGSSGLYRMSQLSRTAAILEEIVKLLLSGPTWPPASSPMELTTLVKAVGRTARTEARLTGPALRES
jgi:CheY-like chemotaxis protein